MAVFSSMEQFRLRAQQEFTVFRPSATTTRWGCLYWLFGDQALPVCDYWLRGRAAVGSGAMASAVATFAVEMHDVVQHTAL
jgi:hypothetical protein